MGFHLEWEDGGLAYFHKDPAAFLLQNFYVKELAENFMMHLLVEDADAWHRQLGEARLVETYGVRTSEIENRSWGLRDFAINDPTGVLWRIGHNIKR